MTKAQVALLVFWILVGLVLDRLDVAFPANWALRALNGGVIGLSVYAVTRLVGCRQCLEADQ